MMIMKHVLLSNIGRYKIHLHCFIGGIVHFTSLAILVSSQANLLTSQQCLLHKNYIQHPTFLETVDISLHLGWCSKEVHCWLKHLNDGASHYSFVRWCSTWYQFKHCSSGRASLHTKWAWVDIDRKEFDICISKHERKPCCALVNWKSVFRATYNIFSNIKSHVIMRLHADKNQQ